METQEAYILLENTATSVTTGVYFPTRAAPFLLTFLIGTDGFGDAKGSFDFYTTETTGDNPCNWSYLKLKHGFSL